MATDENGNDGGNGGGGHGPGPLGQLFQSIPLGPLDSGTNNDGHDGIDIDADVDKDLDIDHDINIDEYELGLTLDLELDTKRVKTKVDRDVDLEYNVTVTYDQHIDGPVTIIDNTQLFNEQDNDGNDIDNKDLININGGGDFAMDDFSLDNLTSNWSFNGAGNDGLTDVNQTNSASNYNWIGEPTLDIWFGGPRFVFVEVGGGPEVNYNGPTTGAKPFQDVVINGGTAYADDGIDGHITGIKVAYDNDGNGIIEGASRATATIDVDVSTFTQDLTLGNNQQQNLHTLNQISGDSTEVSDSELWTPEPVKPDPWPASSSSTEENGETPTTSPTGMLLVENSHFIEVTDNDGNEFKTDDVLDVDGGAMAWFDDIDIGNTGYNASFNGGGNDWQTNVNQSNDLKNYNDIFNPTVSYTGAAPVRSPFQKVVINGGTAGADDGIDSDYGQGGGTVGGDWNASSNDGDGILSGLSLANVDINANIEAFTQDLLTGGNLQVNSAINSLIGGNSLIADGVKGDPLNAVQPAGDAGGDGDGHSADGPAWIGDAATPQHVTDIDDSIIARSSNDDGNQIDNSDFIDISGWAEMDDFTADNVGHSGSFNGTGNDNGFDIDQVNDMVNDNYISNPSVIYDPSTPMNWLDPFQDVEINGGNAFNGEGQGIKAPITGHGYASDNGGDGIVSGTSTASADITANIEAFTQNIVMGANVQANVSNMNVVGGNSTSYDEVDYDG